MSEPRHRRREFICEPLTPEAGTADTAAMSHGEPGLPRSFTRRGRRYTVAEVLRAWKTSSREGGRPEGNLYLRRHWYRFATGTGEVLTVYFDRQSRSRNSLRRWWLYTIEQPAPRA